MRADMAQVVTERPRSGHANRSAKHGGRLTKDLIAREREDDAERGGLIAWSRHRNIDSKDFSDLLGPLRRYLRKQVGRPWAAVYSELSATLDKRSLTGIHIWDHIRMEVAQTCWQGVSGKVYERSRYGGDLPVSGLYVHPVNHILRYAPEYRFRFAPKVNPDLVVLDKFTHLVRAKGLWYRYAFGAVDRYVPERKTRYHTAPAHWVEELVLQRKKQLSRAELKAYGVRNGAAEK